MKEIIMIDLLLNAIPISTQPDQLISYGILSAPIDTSDNIKLLIKDMNVLVSTFSKPSLWKEYEQLISAIMGALAFCIFSGLYEAFKGCRTRRVKMKAALVSFENTRITLLNFKGNFLIPYRHDVSKILRVERNNNDDQLKEVWTGSATPFRTAPPLIVDKISYAQELSFMPPPYLLTLHKNLEFLLEVKEQIQAREKMLARYREKSVYEGGATINQIKDAIFLHRSSCYNLKMTIDTALAMNMLSIEHVNEYAKAYFPFIKLGSFRLKTMYEKLMPSSDYLKPYSQQIQQSICKSFLGRILSRRN